MKMDFKGVMMPEHFFLYANTQNLITIDLLIYSALATSAGYDNLPASMDIYNRELEAYCKCSHPTIKQSLKRLRSAGLITKTDYHTYTINDFATVAGEMIYEPEEI